MLDNEALKQRILTEELDAKGAKEAKLQAKLRQEALDAVAKANAAGVSMSVVQQVGPEQPAELEEPQSIGGATAGKE